MLDAISTLDTTILHMATVMHGSLFVPIASLITALGDWRVVLFVVVAALLILWLFAQRRTIIALVISVVGSEAMVFLGKLAFHRQRPEGALIAESTYSFPSGHATIAIALYMFLAILLARQRQRQWQGSLILAFGIVIAIALGASRIILGVHYLSDILCGYAIGTLWLVIALMVERGRITNK
ncbi:MAG: phosphatase PAP2 family protein [Candidatus Uhrbacteria bacterium]